MLMSKLLHLGRATQCRLESQTFVPGVDKCFSFYDFSGKNRVVICSTCSPRVPRGSQQILLELWSIKSYIFAHYISLSYPKLQVRNFLKYVKQCEVIGYCHVVHP